MPNEIPDWESVSLKTPAAKAAMGERGPGSAKDREAGPAPAAGATTARGLPPVSVIVRRGATLPLTAIVTLTLHPFTGEVLRREAFSDKTLGARLRGSVRPVHTGQGFGLAGQTLALLGALATLVLVYTGFALSWRRFSPRKKK